MKREIQETEQILIENLLDTIASFVAVEFNDTFDNEFDNSTYSYIVLEYQTCEEIAQIETLLTSLNLAFETEIFADDDAQITITS